MTSSAAIKAASGLGAAGAIGGGVALYKSDVFATKTTLRELVQKDKWTLLTASDTTHISTILTAYKKEPNKVTLRFEGFAGTEENANNKLLEECQKASNKLSSDEQKETLLKQIKKWCVVPKTVSARLEDLDLKALDTTAPTGSNNSESQAWIDKGKEHNSGSKKIEGVTTNGDEKANAKALREGCEKKNAVNSYDEDFESSLGISIQWCSVKGN
ncbi:hypothetical protein HF1_13150 [Mycoplasma haemofelis str. Langford 1]|uniref:Uncharacterized protein n=1 Tax=Mycoplasma haemofelis (strain Langford 1) TaxID=941640 RepID=E8ZJK2_MYCHL|nr:hypothetical protein [Mycoplasma haemofelis]CBY93323.1 hypothetical protein HF1_13150 [Mycoplasma haemofelis str. Langford 1]